MKTSPARARRRTPAARGRASSCRRRPPRPARRGSGRPGVARSTAASVCPRRTSTPPSAAGRRGRAGSRSPGSVAESADTPAGAGTVGGADPRADAVLGVHRDRGGGVLVVRGHQRDLEPTWRRHRHADHAAGVADGERHQLGVAFDAADDVALVLAVLVVDDDHAPAGRDVLDGPLDGVQADGAADRHRLRTAARAGAAVRALARIHTTNPITTNTAYTRYIVAVG